MIRGMAQDGVALLRGRWSGIRAARRLITGTLVMDRQELDRWVSTCLARLLLEVRTSVPYYRDLLGGHGESDPYELLQAIPCLSKQIVRCEFDRLISERIPRRRMLFSATGGSTGEPMPYGRDIDRQWLGNAEIELGLSWAGMVRGGRVLLIWGSTFDVSRFAQGWRRVWNRFIHGMYFLPAFAIPSDIRPWVAAIDRFRPHVIVGYAGALNRFAQSCSEAGVVPSWAPKGVISSAEPLDPDARLEIQRVLGAPVLNRYASRELGTVAHECLRQNGLHIFEHGKLVELLDPDGRAVADGELGRIVVTDLFNVGFPLIRYDTGDLARRSRESCTCGLAYASLAEVAGRSTDFLIGSDGTAVSGTVLPHLLKDFPGVEKFQGLQDSSGRIVLRIVAGGGLSATDRGTISQRLEALVHGAQVSVEEVSDIVIPASGKHRTVVSQLSSQRFGPGD